MPDPNAKELLDITRRYFFGRAGFGIGTLALSALLDARLFGAQTNPLAAKTPPLPAKAKSVIYLFMAGAPSQLDLFDYKPKLNQYDGQPVPAELVKGERFAFIQGTPLLLGSPHAFTRHGRSGAEISHLLPHFAEIVDDVSIIKSMWTTQFNHAPAQIYMSTGHQIVGRPSVGAWTTYGLGSENQDLPGFVVLLSGQSQPDGGKSCWGSGFLPTFYQGVEFRRSGDPVLFLSNPDGVDVAARRRSLDLMRDLNQAHEAAIGDPEIETRINSCELAYRMQTSVPDLMDTAGEPEHIHQLYGTEPGKNTFANNCLMARRLVERGVRFVQLFHRGWDTHGSGGGDDIVNRLSELCRATDQAAAALIKDLKQRGLLDSTIVVWGGEFGRTPMNEARDGSKFLGRDHHPRAFTMWIAGGGIRAGETIGSTDDIGYNIAENPVSVHDLHATLLNRLGFDHTRLTYKFQGRDFRLTDVEGEVVKKLLV
ncbi:MAG: DUF1501 domain-containing protein [Bryobacteraceae bacterium]|jgi:uncharacterized protein DUF1501